MIPKLKAGLIFGGLSLLSLNCFSKEKKTNFIVIFCDDMGYGDLSCFGNPSVKTPCLDRLSQEGQKWSNFYVSASVSSPSRAGLLTGRLGVRTGMYGDKKRVLFPESPEGFPKQELTMADILRKNGYSTACIGKWHLGHHEESMPLQHGFDYFYGFPFSNDMSKKEQAKMGNPNYEQEYLVYNQEQIVERDPDQTLLTQTLTQKSIDFIHAHKSEPFFLYLAHPMPHFPVYASERFQGKSLRGAYGDCIEELDNSVECIITELKKLHLDKNTIVIFTSDNGPWLTYQELGGSAGPLREGKASIFDGGFRVPCIIWGGNIKPGLVTDMGSTLDLLPTFCDISNIELPADRVYDGVSLKSTLFDGKKSERTTFAYFIGSELSAFRKGDYKIVFSYKKPYSSDPKIVYDEPLLFNVAIDPEERSEISKRNPQIVEDLIKSSKDYLSTIKIKESIFDK